jgi:chaperonin GroES
VVGPDRGSGAPRFCSTADKGRCKALPAEGRLVAAWLVHTTVSAAAFLAAVDVCERQPIEDRVMNEFVEPLGMRVLIRKDESRHTTRGGIVLPDQAEIPTITGRVVEVSLQVERDADFPIEKYDKVLFHPKNSIPVDFEQNNLLYVVPIEDVVAVFRRHDEQKPRRRGGTDQDEGPPTDEAR